MNSKHLLITMLSVAFIFESSWARAQSAGTSKPLPNITVEASYPGANASVVADTVAAPIEQQVNGIEGMTHMRSRSRDGRYVLTVTFKEGADLAKSRDLVQKRVALAMPVLPGIVVRSGITTRNTTDVLLYLAVSARDHAHQVQFLSDYATSAVIDELNRLVGVGLVSMLGQRGGSVSVWLDPRKLAAHELSAADVTRTIEAHNIQVQAGKIGQPPEPKDGAFHIELKNLGRLKSDHIANIIVKATPEGKIVRVRDLGSVEPGVSEIRDRAFLNGNEIVILAVRPLWGARPREVSEEVRQKLAQLRERAPKGITLDVVMDFTPGRAKAPEHCRIDVDLPISAAPERTIAVLDTCQTLVRKIDGVQDVLALTDPDVSHRGQLLVSLAGSEGAAERAKRIQAMRRLLHDHRIEAAARLCCPSDTIAAPPEYPIHFAIYNDTNAGLDALRKQADVLGRRLAKAEKLSDVWVSRDSAYQPLVELTIDRAKAQALGVPPADIFATLQIRLGSHHVNDFNRFSQVAHVIISGKDLADLDHGKAAGALLIDELKRLMIRNNVGKMVPLGAMASSRVVSAPAVIERYDMEPMIAITANLAQGVTPAEAGRLCEKLAAEVLPAGYRLKWLRP